MITVHMIANAHIDPIWLWPWSEGLDEALATFKSAADRCDEYPELIFCRGEAWLYEKLERYDPALFARVRKHIEDGRWHVMGGQYIQPDLNAPIGESHIRQFERGRAYFEDAFNVHPRVALNVDSFGHPATFPDLVNRLGLKGYVIQRPKSFQKKLPQYFVWTGPDGASLPTFRMSAPYTSMRLSELKNAVDLALQEKSEATDHTMCFFGVGNHGGGPTKAQIEWILENADYADGVRLVFSTPDRFFAETRADLERLPQVNGDLQSCFPGCYSVMHDIHQAQRHGELAALHAGRLNAQFSTDPHRQTECVSILEGAWDDLLFNAFHDIVAGTAVARAWPSVRAIYGRAAIHVEEVAVEASRTWTRRTLPVRNAHQHVFINPLGSDFDGMIEIEPWLEDYSNWDDRWIADETGALIPHQLTHPEANIRSRAVLPMQIPAGGHRVLTIEATPAPIPDLPPSDLWAGPYQMRNQDLDIRLGRGGIASIRWKGRDILGSEGLALHLREDTQDCWGMFGDAYDDPVITRWNSTGWVLEDQGPLRARCRLQGRIGTSRVLMVVRLDKGESKLTIDLTINMDERHKLIQMPIHWATSDRTHWDGGPCQPGAEGTIERSRGPVSEHPFQEFSLARFAKGYDVACMTQDIYSVSHRSDRSILTLLRAPVMANASNKPTVYFGRDDHTDQGVHHMQLSLAFGDTLCPKTLRAESRMMVTPPIHFDFYEGMNRPLPQGPNETEPNSMVNRTELGRALLKQNAVNRE